MNKTAVFRGIWIALIASFSFKLALAWIFFSPLNYWETGYHFFYLIAKNLAGHGSFYFEGSHSLYANQKLYAVCMPLYPFLIAFFGTLTNFSAVVWILLQTGISTATVWLVYKIASSIASQKAAFFAALLYGFHPYALVHDVQLQETALYTFLSTLSIGCLLSAIRQKKRIPFAITGFVFALATLTRASHIVPVSFLMIWMLFVDVIPVSAKPNEPRKFGIVCSLSPFLIVCVLTFALCLSPWLIRNQKQLGSPVLTSIIGGALGVAHHELTFHDYPYRGSIDDSAKQVLARLQQEGKMYPFEPSNELAESRWYQKIAIDYIRAHKLEFFSRGFLKAAVNFLGVPSPLKDLFANLVYFIFFWLLTFLAVKSVPQTWGTHYLQMFLILSASQAFISFLFWTHTSHRAFLDPLLAVLAGIGLDDTISNPRKNYAGVLLKGTL